MRRRKDFELPPEALGLIAQVSTLEEKARNARRRVQQDFDGVRQAAASEREALRLVEERPGITVEQLAADMSVTVNRAWQYVGRLEAGRVRAERA